MTHVSRRIVVVLCGLKERSQIIDSPVPEMRRIFDLIKCRTEHGPQALLIAVLSVVAIREGVLEKDAKEYATGYEFAYKLPEHYFSLALLTGLVLFTLCQTTIMLRRSELKSKSHEISENQLD